MEKGCTEADKGRQRVQEEVSNRRKGMEKGWKGKRRGKDWKIDGVGAEEKE